jgi:hypothetical protein
MSEVTGWRRRLPAALALLLVVCAALVLLGATVEHRGTTETPETSHSEQAERSEAGTGELAGEQGADETVLGVRVESPVALTGLALVSAGLAVLVWRRPTRLVAGAVLVFALVAAVFDGAEIDRQLSAERTALALLAVAVVLLRAATIAGAALMWRND